MPVDLLLPIERYRRLEVWWLVRFIGPMIRRFPSQIACPPILSPAWLSFFPPHELLLTPRLILPQTFFPAIS
ncbi:hypothetical protein [Planctopirus limnophila]|uniref:hypothetical protein n=1 Tax=Planctopirus limnophila TaxID=120 RepID=UPI0001A2F943|nr:hypothetical protein [Planctopirus limnophila]